MTSQVDSSLAAVSAAEAAVPAKITIPYPERLSRLLLFFKWLLVIPLVIIVSFWTIAALVVFIIAFFAILLVGRFPRGLFDFIVSYIRFYLRVGAYFPYLMTDTWWPGGNHPMQFEVKYPEKLSRGISLLKLLSMLLGVVGCLTSVVYFVLILFGIAAWFAILFTGRYPRELYRVALMMYQWTARVDSWQSWLRDEWSLFGTTSTVKIWVVIGAAAAFIYSIWSWFYWDNSMWWF